MKYFLSFLRGFLLGGFIGSIVSVVLQIFVF